MTRKTPPFLITALQCPLEKYLDIFTGAWTSRIIWVLLDEEPKRFAEIQRKIGKISAKVLSSKLRELESADIVERKVIPSNAPVVEYKPTPKGKLLEPTFREMERAAIALFPSSPDAQQEQ